MELLGKHRKQRFVVFMSAARFVIIASEKLSAGDRLGG
jgi:hypothetical protein